jgi:ankyrin repeat domain-containing protein 50
VDPVSALGVAASAAGIISLGIQVTQSLVDYYTATKYQDSEVAHIVKEPEHLLGVLQALQNHLAARKFAGNANEVLRRTIESSIQACEDCIQELRRECDKFTRYW